MYVLAGTIKGANLDYPIQTLSYFSVFRNKLKQRHTQFFKHKKKETRIYLHENIIVRRGLFLKHYRSCKSKSGQLSLLLVPNEQR